MSSVLSIIRIFSDSGGGLELRLLSIKKLGCVLGLRFDVGMHQPANQCLGSTTTVFKS